MDGKEWLAAGLTTVIVFNEVGCFLRPSDYQAENPAIVRTLELEPADEHHAPDKEVRRGTDESIRVTAAFVSGVALEDPYYIPPQPAWPWQNTSQTFQDCEELPGSRLPPGLQGNE